MSVAEEEGHDEMEREVTYPNAILIGKHLQLQLKA